VKNSPINQTNCNTLIVKAMGVAKKDNKGNEMCARFRFYAEDVFFCVSMIGVHKHSIPQLKEKFGIGNNFFVINHIEDVSSERNSKRLQKRYLDSYIDGESKKLLQFINEIFGSKFEKILVKDHICKTKG